MKALDQNIKRVTAIPIQVLVATTNGSAIDTFLSGQPAFETVLVDIAVGNLGTQASTAVKIEESDSATFASGVTTAKGGEEITVAADTGYKMEIERIKRYLRAVVTLTTPGVTPTVETYIGMILWNATKPFPIL